MIKKLIPTSHMHYTLIQCSIARPLQGFKVKATLTGIDCETAQFSRFHAQRHRSVLLLTRTTLTLVRWEMLLSAAACHPSEIAATWPLCSFQLPCTHLDQSSTFTPVRSSTDFYRDVVLKTPWAELVLTPCQQKHYTFAHMNAMIDGTRTN